MADHDPILITLTKDAAVAKLAELTGADLGSFSVVKDGVRFEVKENGSVSVNLDLSAIITSADLAEIIQAAGFLPAVPTKDQPWPAARTREILDQIVADLGGHTASQLVSASKKAHNDRDKHWMIRMARELDTRGYETLAQVPLAELSQFALFNHTDGR